MSRTATSPLHRDHGGGRDAAIARFGGTRTGWLDLSTGINPVPYPLPDLQSGTWTDLPDSGAMDRLLQAARDFWQVPDKAEILACHGASAAIARLPSLVPAGRVRIDTPTYNEHAAAFAHQGWTVTPKDAACMVVVHPNNPDGRLWQTQELTAPLTIIDESFCDTVPQHSLMNRTKRHGTLILKSFGKFWGLAGVRLGFVIGDSDLIAGLRETLGPWSVSGPALEIGAAALQDQNWATATRARLKSDAARLDRVMLAKGAQVVGGTTLFRLYQVEDAVAWQTRLAKRHVWSRVFPYSKSLLRLGLPAPDRWEQLESAL